MLRLCVLPSAPCPAAPEHGCAASQAFSARKTPMLKGLESLSRLSRGSGSETAILHHAQSAANDLAKDHVVQLQLSR